MVLSSLTDRIRFLLTGGGKRGQENNVRNLTQQNADRLAGYSVLRALYDGFTMRQNANGTDQIKEFAFALAGPIVNISADFLAGNPLVWTVLGADGEKDVEATKRAALIWENSGAEGEFLLASINGAIYGDMPVIVRRQSDDDKSVFLQFPTADIVFPIFATNNRDMVRRVVIGYSSLNAAGERENYYEEFDGGQWWRNIEGEGETSGEYDAEIFDGGTPCVWIRNLGLGEMFGRSDLKPLRRLLERYDHAGEKELDIIDYYSSPNVVAKGMTIPEIQAGSIPFGFRKLFAIKETATLEYLEWKGDRPDVEKGLEHIRDALSEIAETPAIAFGKLPQGLTQISGVALRILYGPLLTKTRRKRASYGPALERAMTFALRESGISIESSKQVNITWQDPTPANLAESWETALNEEEAGLSEAEALRRRGYDDDAIKKIQAEKDEEQTRKATIEAKAFDAGGGGADNRNPNL